MSFGELCINRLHASGGEQEELEREIQAQYGKEMTVMFLRYHPTKAEGWKAAAWNVHCRSTYSPLVTVFAGRVVKAPRDLIIAIFSDSAQAIQCSLACLSVASAQDKYSVSIGVDVGPIFDLGDDLFGNAVNLSSKLCEDVADPHSTGIALTARTYEASGRAGIPVGDPIAITVSGAEIEYYHLTREQVAGNELYEAAVSKISDVGAEEADEAVEWAQAFVRDETPVKYIEKGVLMVSDMSGMTRISKSKGSLHFLGLIYQMRAICEPIYTKRGGKLLGTEGDDLLLCFQTPGEAFSACKEMLVGVAEYNKLHTGEHEQILMGMGLAQGEYMLCDGKDVQGGCLEVAFALGESVADPFEIWMDQDVGSQAELAQKESKDGKEWFVYRLSGEAQKAEADLSPEKENKPEQPEVQKGCCVIS